MDEFHLRWNSKKIVCYYNSDNQCTPNYLQENYSSAGHGGFSIHVSVTLMDKIYPLDLLERRDYWRCTYYAMNPCGLDIEDCLITHLLVWKFDISFILFIYFIYFYCFSLILFIFSFIYFFHLFNTIFIFSFIYLFVFILILVLIISYCHETIFYHYNFIIILFYYKRILIYLFSCIIFYLVIFSCYICYA